MAGEEHRRPAACAQVLRTVPGQLVALAASDAHVVDLVVDHCVRAHGYRVLAMRAEITSITPSPDGPSRAVWDRVVCIHRRLRRAGESASQANGGGCRRLRFLGCRPVSSAVCRTAPAL